MVYDEKDAYYQILIFYHLDFFFLREFQPTAFAPNDSTLLSD